ncbi:MAG: Dabb family protein [Pirellulaceae bacterium]
MSRLWLFSLALIGMSIVGASMLATDAQGADAGKVLRHVVLYKFKETVAPAQVQEVVAAFAGLPKKIDTIIGFEWGTNVSPEGKSEGLTHAFVVTFQDEAGRAAYLKHPAHDAYVLVVKDKRERAVVFDYWADK